MTTAELTEREFAAIGRVAQSWARLEGTLNLLVTGMLGGPVRTSALVVPSMGSRLAAEFAAGLASMYFAESEEDKLAAVVKLTRRHGKLAPRRNDAVHQMWTRGSQPDSLKPYGIKVRETVKIATQEAKASEFIQLAKEIDQLTGDLFQFVQENGLLPKKDRA